MKYVIALVLALSFATHVHAGVTFNPNVSATSKKRIQAAYNALPWQSRQGEVTVRLGKLRKGVAATYNIQNDLITMTPGYAIPYYFAHEMGHRTQDEILSDAQYDDWNAFWAVNKAKMPNYYARKTPKEGFAEVYANLYGPRWFVLDPVVKQKMQSYFK